MEKADDCLPCAVLINCGSASTEKTAANLQAVKSLVRSIVHINRLNDDNHPENYSLTNLAIDDSSVHQPTITDAHQKGKEVGEEENTIEISCSVRAVPIQLETKYYSAGVGLAYLTEKTLGTAEFSEAVEAVVFYCDDDAEEGWEGRRWTEELDGWVRYTTHWEPSVQILAWNQTSSLRSSESPADQQIRKQESINQWCLKNGFEMVELSPDAEAREAAAEWKEAIGIARVLQILKAHSWSNLELKEYDSQATANRLAEYLKDEEDEQPKASTSAAAKNDGKSSEAESADSDNVRKKKLNNVLDGDMDALFRDLTDADGEEVDHNNGESFEQLFHRLASLKEEAGRMGPEHRQEYAEKVTMAFWKAIGGEEEEIGDL